MLAVALFAALLLVTALGAVPQHRVLGQRFDGPAYRRLLAWDSARVVVALAQVLVGVIGVSLVWSTASSGITGIAHGLRGPRNPRGLRLDLPRGGGYSVAGVPPVVTVSHYP